MAGSKSRRSSGGGTGASTPSRTPLDTVLDPASVGSPSLFTTSTKELKSPEDLGGLSCSVVGINERESSSGAVLWMSEESMVANSVNTGTFVAVSVRGSDPTSTLASLRELCGSYFKVAVPSVASDKSGAFYSVALAWPSRKLSRNGVLLSKHLATTLGYPAKGSLVLLNPLETSSSEQLKYNRCKTSSIASIVRCSHLILRWCPVLESSGVIKPPPPNSGFQTPSRSSKYVSRTGMSPSQEGSAPKNESFRNSPSLSPADKMESRKLAASPAGVIQEVRNVTQTSGNASAVWSIFENNIDKDKSLVEIFASRWLCGRFLLPGNLVSLPICGCDCLFEVSEAKSSDEEESGDCGAVGGLPPPPLSVYKVRHNTKITLLAPSEARVKSEEPLQRGADSQSLQSSIKTAEKVSPDVERVEYAALGGLAEQIGTIKQLVELSLLHSHLFTLYGLQAPRGLLLYGPPGTGKSTLARAAACEAGVPLFAINGPDVVSQFYGESEEALKAVFTAAEEAAPSVVVIDEVDAIAPERKDGSEDLAQRMVGALLKLMDEGTGKQVLVIAATNRPDALDPALRRPGRFDREIEIGVPSPKGRREILEALLGNLKHTLQASEVLELAASTHGFVGADLSSLCHEAALAALRRSIGWTPRVPPSHVPRPEVETRASSDAVEESTEAPDLGSLCSAFKGANLSDEGSNLTSDFNSKGHFSLEITTEDFEAAKTRVWPSAMREVILEVPKVRWADIGGQEEVKQELQEAVEWPQLHGEAFARIGAQPPRGVLLYGPPGCSKTLLASAVASESGLNFIAVKGPELFSKWVGESEKAVQKLFARARAAAPSIVFFDEIDGLAVARDSGHGDGLSVGDRVMSQLLTEMDGSLCANKELNHLVDTSTGLRASTGVAVIAATNRPDIIDSALLRPGRFDRLLYVGPPNEAAREKIFQIQLRHTPCSPLVHCSVLAARTPSYTGADISAVCREAAMAGLEEDVGVQQVEFRHFEIALARVAPSDPGPKHDFFTKFNRGSAST